MARADVSAGLQRMKYLRQSVSEAMNEVIMKTLPAHTGGCVGVSRDAEVYASYNTAGMFTGLSDYTGRCEAYHKDDLSGAAAVDFDIVPRVVDAFPSTGVLKVMYPRPTGGSTSSLRVAIGPGVRLDPAMAAVDSKPSVYFTLFDAEQQLLHTLVMVCVAPRPRVKVGGQVSATNAPPDVRLAWMVCDIPDTDVDDGTQVVHYGENFVVCCMRFQ